MKQVHIFDIDGVLIDSSHRFKTDENGKIDLEHWNANKHLCVYDSLLPHSEGYIQDVINPEIYTVIATARNFSNLEWEVFNDLLPYPDHFIHRAENDERGSIAMKIAGLKKLFALRQFHGKRKFFFEDTETVLNAVCRAIGAIPVHVPSNQGVWE